MLIPARRSTRAALVALVAATVGLPVLGVANAGAKVANGKGSERENMRLLGMDDLQARSAYQPTIHHHAKGDRWIAYVGHHGGTAENPLTGQEEPNGTSIVDVTNPKQAALPGPHPRRGAGRRRRAAARRWRACATAATLPRRPTTARSTCCAVRQLGPRDLGRDRPGQAGKVMTVVERPARHAQELVGVRHRHRVPRVRRAGLAHRADDPDLRPERSRRSRCSSATSGCSARSRAATGPSPTGLHGPISPGNGNRVYFGYGTGADGIMQIVDREKLLTGRRSRRPRTCSIPQVARLDLPPERGRAHDVPGARRGGRRVRPTSRSARRATSS